MKAIWIIFILTLSIGFLSACAIPLNAVRFDVWGETTPVKSNDPITIKTPDPIEKRVHIFDPSSSFRATYSVDFDAVNIQAAELIGDELAKNAIVVTKDSKKTIMFVAKKMTWEGGWTRSIHMYFEVEAGNGYKREYKVVGVSGATLDRALGDAITSAVIKIFQDGNILKYIESSTDTDI